MDGSDGGGWDFEDPFHIAGRLRRISNNVMSTKSGGVVAHLYERDGQQLLVPRPSAKQERNEIVNRDD